MPPELCQHKEIKWEISDAFVDDETFSCRIEVICNACGKVWKKDIDIES